MHPGTRRSVAASGIVALGLLTACTASPSATAPATRSPAGGAAYRHTRPVSHGGGRTTSPAGGGHAAGAPIRGVALVMPETEVSQPSTPITHRLPRRPRGVVRFATPDGNHYVVDTWARVTSHDCAGAAVGPAAAYLRRHRCASLTRVLATSRIDSRPVGFAEQTVTMHDASAAHRLRALVRHGPGVITTLFSDGHALPSGPESVPGLQFLVAVRGDRLTTMYYWYVVDDTPWEDPVLERFAKDMFLGYAGGRR